jgi:T-complex protein 1 subunit zeta
LDDKALIPGAGAYEIAASVALKEHAKTVVGKARLGVIAYADALLVIPRTLAENSGLDWQDVLLRLISEYETTQQPVGLDLVSGNPISPAAEGIWDNYFVKRQFLQLAPVLAEQLLLVDEVMRTGKQMGSNSYNLDGAQLTLLQTQSQAASSGVASQQRTG